MEAGLQVRLNPAGGNQLNIREALKLCLPPDTPPSDDIDEEEQEENGTDVEPRRNLQDDYDYDDDFIDDDDVFEDEVAATPPNEEEDDDFEPGSEEEGGKVLQKAPVHHGFGSFWVNKGNLPPKKDTAIPQPPSALGNVVLEHLPAQNAPTPLRNGANGNSSSKSAKPATAAQQPTSVQKKAGDGSPRGPSSGTATVTDGTSIPTNSNTVPTPNQSKPPTPRPSQASRNSQAAKAKTVQESVLAEIAKLATLCQTEFGDKKPKLSDPKVQEQLHVMFRVAIASGLGRLFSDIAKDKRVVALADEVWNRLAFLRVKRANLETLGHALLWSAKEKAAISTVEKTETELERFMRERRGEAVAGAALLSVSFDKDLDEKIFEWYRAKSELQMAKNQLGSRVKSVKKCIAGWVAGLKKTAFQGWSVAEGEIVEAFRRVEEVRNAAERQRKELERQRRENEKLEKKRKREEQLAAAAAKKAAIESSKAAAAAGAAAAAAAATPTPREVVGVTSVKPKAKLVKPAAKSGVKGPAGKAGLAKAQVSKPSAKMSPGKATATGNTSAAKTSAVKTLGSKTAGVKPPTSKSSAAKGVAGKSPTGKTAQGKLIASKASGGKTPPGKPGNGRTALKTSTTKAKASGEKAAPKVAKLVRKSDGGSASKGTLSTKAATPGAKPMIVKTTATQRKPPTKSNTTRPRPTQPGQTSVAPSQQRTSTIPQQRPHNAPQRPPSVQQRPSATPHQPPAPPHRPPIPPNRPPAPPHRPPAPPQRPPAPPQRPPAPPQRPTPPQAPRPEQGAEGGGTEVIELD